ncbi:MAG TPA: protein-L-isoaspartate O-methyltransferase, partial [Steroidobacteraceae bacterium]|nr:protein-L-isoaspartate O-methyltransferase [Steroidobacteraceae bacterium]
MAREQMVEQQVRACDVLDEHILETLRAVPREQFMPRAWRELAFAECEIPLPLGKRMLRPLLVGRILQALAVRPGEQVLEIGTGSGYVTACLGRLAGRARSLELHPPLAKFARDNLATGARGVPIEVVEADGMELSEESRYDVILLTASLPIYQARFERALRLGGRLFVAVGNETLQQARLVRRATERDWVSRVLFETCIEALDHA